MVKKITNEELARMVQDGFSEARTELQTVEKRLNDRFDRIEFNTNSQERRISILEDKVQMISTKIGLKK